MASVMILSANGDTTFTLEQFVNQQAAPLVVIKYGASWCQPCKEIEPTFERLARAAHPHIGCFSVDVDQDEGIALEAQVEKLPTFVFYTTKLNPARTLMVVDKVVGPNAALLQENFQKALQIVSQLAQQQQSPQPPQQQQQQPQTPPSTTSVTAPQKVSTSATAAMNPNDIVKKELVEIRNNLIASIQRIEKLYAALQ
jgi:thiol-disulfide isomerase/thioredoxin